MCICCNYGIKVEMFNVWVVFVECIQELFDQFVKIVLEWIGLVDELVCSMKV